MAIVFCGSQCAVCEKVIAIGEHWMHGSCFEAWPERERFSDSPRSSTTEENRAHNEEHLRVMARVCEQGGSCPHCGTRSTSYRELNETDRARLVCRVCGRSCFATELIVDPR